MSQDSYQLLNNYKYNYGTISKQAVVEQNQTYMAYFDGVGGTGPELIDQTAYFIKYIIDTQGNVTNPEPDVIPSRPQAVALYNLIDNFEPGKNAVVKLIGNDPLSTENPNDDALTGIHPITHVGRIVPILVTETGVNNEDYITTMSFGPLSSETTDPVGNVSARRFYVNNNPGYFFANESLFTDIPFNSATSLGANNTAWTVSGATIIAQSSSVEARTRIRFKINLYIDGRDMDTIQNHNTIQCRIIKNGTDVVWNTSIIVVFEDTNRYVNFGYSNYVDFEINDQFKAQYRIFTTGEEAQFKILGYDSDVGYVSDTSLTIEQETPASPGGTVDVELIDGVNAIYAFPSSSISASYCAILDNPTQGYSDVVFFSSSRFIYDSGLIQNLDSASSAINFSPITIPFGDTKPGDFIRFEYNKEQVYTITGVTEDYLFLGVPIPNTLAFKVVPNIGSTQGVNTSIQRTGHFVIYRVINDGTYIVLDVPKPVAGNSFTGIIQPEFISKELTDNYDKIIMDLTSKEIIN
jgi:hypothetical protein